MQPTNNQTTFRDCPFIQLPQHHDRRGNLTALHNGVELPEQIARIFYLYDVPAGAERGGHAHRELVQYIVAASGSFEVILDDGEQQERHYLNRPNQALRVAPGIWSQLRNFSGGAICMVLATARYDEADYIRSYEQFIAYRHAGKTV